MTGPLNLRWLNGLANSLSISPMAPEARVAVLALRVAHGHFVCTGSGASCSELPLSVQSSHRQAPIRRCARKRLMHYSKVERLITSSARAKRGPSAVVVLGSRGICARSALFLHEKGSRGQSCIHEGNECHHKILCRRAELSERQSAPARGKIDEQTTNYGEDERKNERLKSAISFLPLLCQQPVGASGSVASATSILASYPHRGELESAHPLRHRFKRMHTR
jgi:hypothetical protein